MISFKRTTAIDIRTNGRSVGIGLAYIIFFLFLYLFFCEYNEGAKQNGEMLVFPIVWLKR